MKEKFIALLTFTSSLRNFGTKFIRVAILVVFVWIGGLKYFHYEADGIVPFVANSPFMSFFYAKEAPEYKNFKNPEGALVPENRAWHEANNTYTFSYGLGALIMSIGILVFLGIFFPKVGLVGDSLAIIMTLGTLSFLVTTPEVWVPNLGSGEFGFPLLSGAGRLVIKDIVILAGALFRNQHRHRAKPTVRCWQAWAVCSLPRPLRLMKRPTIPVKEKRRKRNDT